MAKRFTERSSPPPSACVRIEQALGWIRESHMKFIAFFTIVTMGYVSFSFAQQASVNTPPDRSFELFIGIIGVLLTIAGFCATFLLNSMWGDQKSQGKQLTQILERMSAQDQKFEALFERVAKLETAVEDKCDYEDCPQQTRRKGRHG